MDCHLSTYYNSHSNPKAIPKLTSHHSAVEMKRGCCSNVLRTFGERSNNVGRTTE